MTRGRFLALLPLAVFAIGALWLLAALLDGPAKRSSPLVGRPAPALSLPALVGPEAAIAFESGQFRIVNFWASWCAPCRIEHPNLEALATLPGAELIGVAYKDRTADARAHLAELGDPYAAVLTDLDGRAAITWGVTGVPETFVVAPDGRILHHVAGPIDQIEADRIAALIRGGGPSP